MVKEAWQTQASRESQFRLPPSTSGNDVVASAQMTRVGAKESDCRTRPLGCTRSRHGPS
jgi:hypothetical protein